MAISRSQINAIKDFSLRTILLGMYDQHVVVGQALGINILEPTNSPQTPASTPPPAVAFSVLGANGSFNISITNPKQSINKTLYHELSYSGVVSFVGPVTTLPIQTTTQMSVPAPGVTAFWRLRSSYDQHNWNAYQTQPGKVSSGLQSSAASEAAVALNQTNYANVDSVDAGSSAVVRVFGKAGPNTQYPSVKGSQETIRPSATIVNVPFSSQQVVGFDEENYQVRSTLPEQLIDKIVPTGTVSVVGPGGFTLPTIVPIEVSGGILGFNVTSGGTGITAPLTITIIGTGTGATAGAQVISGGVLISVAPGNAGSGYGPGTTVTVSGGTFGGSTGGGQNIGGNGGRFIVNDGTTN